MGDKEAAPALTVQISLFFLVLPDRIELSTSPLPRKGPTKFVLKPKSYARNRDM
jgi:hypothetical protein